MTKTPEIREKQKTGSRELESPAASREPRMPQRIPFREQLPQPTLEYKSAIGRWLARGESLDDHVGCRGLNPSMVEGYLADGSGLLFHARVSAGHCTARGGSCGAACDSDPCSRHDARRTACILSRSLDEASPGRVRLPCSKTCLKVGRARCWCSSCSASRPRISLSP